MPKQHQANIIHLINSTYGLGEALALQPAALKASAAARNASACIMVLCLLLVTLCNNSTAVCHLGAFWHGKRFIFQRAFFGFLTHLRV